MKKDKNFDLIRDAIATAKTSLEREAQEMANRIKAEVETQTAKAQTKLLEAMEDPEKLSAKDKRERQMSCTPSSRPLTGII